MTAPEFRFLLKASGLTQRALAARLGKDTTTVNRWARGTLPVPQYAIAYLLANIRNRGPSEQKPKTTQR